MDFKIILQVIVFIISVIFHVFIINWLNKMNSCKCSSTYSEKIYLYEWFIIVVIWLFIYNIIFISNGGNISMPLTVVNMIVGFINIVMIIRLFIYLRKLRETKCNCGTLREVNIIYYYLIVAFSVLAFVVVVSIILGIFTATVAPKIASAKKNKSLK
jgi:hypothetical protein